jgi:hypothetical protein
LSFFGGLANFTQRRTKIRKLRELYYITHVNNIPSILQRGILSHERIDSENIDFTPIYDKDIVSYRKDIITPSGKSLWTFANLYFRARNPMLYRVVFEKGADSIAVVGADKRILKLDGVFVTDGNAASSYTQMSLPSNDILFEILKETDRKYWNNLDSSKRKIMAECLVPEIVPLDYIKSIYFPSYEALTQVDAKISPLGRHIPLSREPYMFFQPEREIELTKLLSIVDGDMFFSRLHTLTISVNCVGVMGKGIASRAKYQFPDVYVKYQDLCRSRKLKLGKPYLHKREVPFDYILADQPETMKNRNEETWFLLFPTKKHWRYHASISGIEEGLQWICANYKKEGIRSLAIPALGCGLGWLDWKDVGPLLCKYLSTLDIPVKIYLPVEKEIPDEFISREFLLKQGYQEKVA